MTIVLRAGSRGTITFQQEGSRVRVELPADTDDDAMTTIVDLKSDERIVVYDDVKAYFDMNKMLAAARAAMESLRKSEPPERRRKEVVSYRALGRTRTVNGFTCAMHQHVVGGKVEAEVCFALWGGPIGSKEDFAWYDAFFDRMVADLGGKRWLAGMARARDAAPGLAIWTSSIEGDRKREVMEIVKVSRDPLPVTLFHLPADYTEISRPLSASERSHGVPPPIDLSNVPGLKKAEPPRSGLRISGGAAIMIVIFLVVGLVINALILHLAASMALDRPRFGQALVAATILWLVVGAVELLHLPEIFEVPLGLLAVFAGLKIAYGASMWRTLALGVVMVLIAMLMAFVGRIFA